MRTVSQYVAQKLAVIPLSGGNLSEGGELYRIHCASCHRTDVRGGALGFVGRNAPSLVNKSPALVAGAIRWGPGAMPSFPPSALSDQQVASIVDYVVTVQHPVNRHCKGIAITSTFHRIGVGEALQRTVLGEVDRFSKACSPAR